MKLVNSLPSVIAILLIPLAVHYVEGPSIALADTLSPATLPSDHLDLLVIDGSTHQPLAHASGSVNSAMIDEQKFSVGPDGHAILPVPRNNGFGFFEISVHAGGYVGKLLEWSEKDKDSIPGQYTVAMVRGVRIGGRIIDDAGQPVAGAHIVLWMGRQQSTTPHERYDIDADDIQSAAHGDWTFAEAPPDFQSIEMGCWDYGHANGDYFPMKSLTPQQLHAGNETYVLQCGLPVTGLVLNAAGKPLAGADVLTGAQMCSNRVPSQKTDAAGRFHYVAKPGDEVTLTITCHGYAPELKQFLVGNEKHETTIQLSKSRPLIGHVVGPKGEPIPFAWVYPDTWRGNRSLEVRIHADKDGKFQWKERARRYRLLRRRRHRRWLSPRKPRSAHRLRP